MPAIMTENFYSKQFEWYLTPSCDHFIQLKFWFTIHSYYPIQCCITSKAERVEEEPAVSTFSLQIEIAGSYEMLVKSQKAVSS
jgi:hypothetical protein